MPGMLILTRNPSTLQAASLGSGGGTPGSSWPGRHQPKSAPQWVGAWLLSRNTTNPANSEALDILNLCFLNSFQHSLKLKPFLIYCTRLFKCSQASTFHAHLVKYCTPKQFFAKHFMLFKPFIQVTKLKLWIQYSENHIVYNKFCPKEQILRWRPCLSIVSLRLRAWNNRPQLGEHSCLQREI